MYVREPTSHPSSVSVCLTGYEGVCVCVCVCVCVWLALVIAWPANYGPENGCPMVWHTHTPFALAVLYRATLSESRKGEKNYLTPATVTLSLCTWQLKRNS